MAVPRPVRKVPFFDWAALFREHRDDYVRIFAETADRGGFILQRDVEEFETALRGVTGSRHAVALADCTNAMSLGLRALGIGPGDEVLIPSHTFLATAQAVVYAGATPVPVDIDARNLMDAAATEAAITPRARALMPVQVNGTTADMDALGDVARRHGLALVEDSAQALGATYKGRQAGTFGAWGAFSFYPSKTLGGFGDAGALVTDDDEIAAGVRAMRNHGSGVDKVIPADTTVWGTNSRIDNIHAAILAYKLTRHYDADIARRRAIAARYDSALADIEEVARPAAPGADPERFDVFQNYEIETRRRDALRAHLAEDGIGTILQWGGTAIHQFRGLGFTQTPPRADAFFRRCLLLPMNHLLSDDDVDHVGASVRRFFGRPA